MEHPPTFEQEQILNELSNCVVIAKPGTGKTFTLSLKIKNLLADLPYYKGVIAISFTNKASDELEDRTLSKGTDRKNSFFGTIDKFFITEIIIPFGNRVFGKFQHEISVVKFADLDPEQYPAYNPNQDDHDNIPLFEALYIGGKILLEKIGFLAVYIFENSFACRRYINARYTHIFIDEYQDCDAWQHSFFARLVETGLIGHAVGDLDQSIFAFADKSPVYLSSLATNDAFHTYVLTENHRSHISIVNYSTKLLSSTYIPHPADEIRVFDKQVEGSETEIAQWLTHAIPEIAHLYGVEILNKVGILFKNKATGNLIHRNLELRHKPLVTTPLDEDSSLWGSVFRKTLIWAFNPDQTKYELAEYYLNMDQVKAVNKIMGTLQLLEENIQNGTPLIESLELFQRIALLIYPNYHNQKSLTNLELVLTQPILLDSFVPPADDEIQLLTLHKAKGKEFDIVFHLNLYQWILPQYKGDYEQDRNLHYVGITRAKECCVLCWSTYRHRGDGISEAAPSEFLSLNNLHELREPLNL